MNINITIKDEDPFSSEAYQLMEELSYTLEVITGSSGKGSFNLNDFMGDRALFVIARNDQGEAVGCGAIRAIDYDTGEIKRMYAKEPGLGIGTKILTYLEAEALKHGYTKLKLETRIMNLKAVEFYKKNGYHVIPNYGMYVTRPEAVCFEKQLLQDTIISLKS